MWENIKGTIDLVIKTNNNQEITGAVLNNLLKTIVDTVGAPAMFAGLATPSTNPGTPDGPVFYFATEAGTYSNFDAAVIQEGITILKWDGTSWVAISVFDKSVITAIQALIPAEASANNQLADKNFVNSTVATSTATFRGNYNLIADLDLTTSATQAQISTALASAVNGADNNDYVFVQIPTSSEKPTEIIRIERYKFNSVEWRYEYSLNNSGFTASQWAAINSGINVGLVSKLNQLPDVSVMQAALNNKQNVIQDLAEIRAGAQAGGTAVQPSALDSFYTKQEVDSKVAGAQPAGDTEVEEDGFFVTDSAGNVAMEYTKEKGFDAAKVAQHFRDLILGGNADGTVSLYGYKSFAEAVKHLIVMDAVNKKPIYAELTSVEKELFEDAVSKYVLKNPNNKYMAFAVLSDLHQIKEGGAYTGSGASIEADAEPSIKLLGALAERLNLDAVFCLGDLSTGLRQDCNYEEYLNVMQKVRGMFQQHIGIPSYVTMGNHDENPYSSGAEDVHMPMATWFDYLKSFCWYTPSAELHFMDNGDTNYYVDFPKKDFRMIMLNNYQNIGSKAFEDLYKMLTLDDEQAGKYTLCYAAHHGRPVDDGRFAASLLSGNTLTPGSGTGNIRFPAFQNLAHGHIGWIQGHLHQSSHATRTYDNYTFNEIKVANCFSSQSDRGTADAYCFSIFVVDTDTDKLYEIQVGRFNNVYEGNIAHN